MKIDDPLPPQAPPRPAGRRPRQTSDPAAGNEPPASQALDTVQISARAAALRSATSAGCVDPGAQELIAKENLEAVITRPADVKRFVELVRSATKG